MSQNMELANYYAERAVEYEQVYLKPERQAAIEWLNLHLIKSLLGRKVLEVACGTGFWTQTIAKSAFSVVATDVNNQVLDIAQQKLLPIGKVKFVKDDAFLLQNIPNEEFSAGFAGFWWSHIPSRKSIHFLQLFTQNYNPVHWLCLRITFMLKEAIIRSCVPIAREILIKIGFYRMALAMKC